MPLLRQALTREAPGFSDSSKRREDVIGKADDPRPGYRLGPPGGTDAAHPLALAGSETAAAPPVPPPRLDNAPEAAQAYRLAMSCLVSGVTLALLILIWHLRKRSHHPLPEPESVSSILLSDPTTEPPDPAEEEDPADWWRRDR